MAKDVILTPEGLAARIKEARDFGDISENAEYDDAKNEQAMVEARIAQLEERLRSATVINASELDNDVVGVGSIVYVSDADGAEHTYHIVGSAEAKPAEHKLSNESPVGKALVGKHQGEVATVSTPKGERTLTINKIEVA
jgi:transcription elongation factor GreA